MPKAMEEALARVADKKGLTGARRSAFIYGTMRKTGWKPDREKKMMDKKKMANVKKRMMKNKLHKDMGKKEC